LQKTLTNISMFLYFVGFLTFTGLAFAEVKPVGKIIGITGMVDFRSASESESVAKGKAGSVKPISFTPWGKAKPHQLVYAKDIFRTSRKSRLKILFDDKSMIALGPKSKMKVASYIYKPKEKLRRGVINVAQGLSMYIINKSQKNKKSSFRIVTPTANIAARGTQGYISVSGTQTIVANQDGAVEVNNSDLSVAGQKLVEAMMKSIISLGQSPSEPTALTESELAQIRNVIIAWVGSRFPDLITEGDGSGDDEGDGEGEGDFEEAFELFDDAFSESCTAG
jgi:hypothetical protein